ncbi:DUF1990 family protein [Nocardia crassostreae]|uniref:DUF1990 family protein n=1 Tax=Nocardia crassostreae TaxID=53428 RepID=UPI00082EAC1E|nr:DUF1990 domain-containing protein [Nocardia crassostreae]
MPFDPPHDVAFSYPAIGATAPARPDWPTVIPTFRHYDRTVAIGRGDADWLATVDAVLTWGIKRRSGFRITPLGVAADRVTAGADYRISAFFGPFAVHEPVRVVAVVDTPTRAGFAYGTLPGHPVSGEEAFVVHRDPDGTVFLTLRSLTRPARSGPWRALFPILPQAQRFYRRRYLRALTRGGS